MLELRSARPRDAAAMLEIYRPSVEQSGISFEFEVPSEDEFAERIRTTLKRFPWLVAIGQQQDSATATTSAADSMLGYAYSGPHRARDAYQWSCEVSAYVVSSAHRLGVGRRLYQELFARLEAQGYRNAYAGITLPNDPSQAFHAALGFQPIGVYPRVGWKLGQWRDVAWWGLELGEKEERPARRVSDLGLT